MTWDKLNLAMVGCGDIASSYLDGAAKTRRCRIVQVMDVNERWSAAST